MKIKFSLLWVLYLSLVISNAWAWNAVGHRLIAEIAYQQLSPAARQEFNAYNRLLERYPHAHGNFVASAAWLDQLHAKELRVLKPMHYIDLAFSTDNTPLPTPNPLNVVWAIRQAQIILCSSAAQSLDKAIALRILVHTIGDIHQPLHAVSQVSHTFPEGDAGGNKVILIKNPIAKNLHEYWDRGAGLFIVPRKHHLRPRDIKVWAKAINTQWPCNKGKEAFAPMAWARESQQIAITQIYRKPFLKHIELDQELATQRVAIAGCRLGWVLQEAYQLEHNKRLDL